MRSVGRPVLSKEEADVRPTVRGVLYDWNKDRHGPPEDHNHDRGGRDRQGAYREGGDRRVGGSGVRERRTYDRDARGSGRMQERRREPRDHYGSESYRENGNAMRGSRGVSHGDGYPSDRMSDWRRSEHNQEDLRAGSAAGEQYSNASTNLPSNAVPETDALQSSTVLFSAPERVEASATVSLASQEVSHGAESVLVDTTEVSEKAVQPRRRALGPKPVPVIRLPGGDRIRSDITGASIDLEVTTGGQNLSKDKKSSHPLKASPWNHSTTATSSMTSDGKNHDGSSLDSAASAVTSDSVLNQAQHPAIVDNRSKDNRVRSAPSKSRPAIRTLHERLRIGPTVQSDLFSESELVAALAAVGNVALTGSTAPILTSYARDRASQSNATTSSASKVKSATVGAASAISTSAATTVSPAISTIAPSSSKRAQVRADFRQLSVDDVSESDEDETTSTDSEESVINELSGTSGVVAVDVSKTSADFGDSLNDGEEFVEVLSRAKLKEKRQQEEERQRLLEKRRLEKLRKEERRLQTKKQKEEERERIKSLERMKRQQHKAHLDMLEQQRQQQEEQHRQERIGEVREQLREELAEEKPHMEADENAPNSQAAEQVSIEEDRHLLEEMEQKRQHEQEKESEDVHDLNALHADHQHPTLQEQQQQQGHQHELEHSHQQQQQQEHRQWSSNIMHGAAESASQGPADDGPGVGHDDHDKRVLDASRRAWAHISGGLGGMGGMGMSDTSNRLDGRQALWRTGVVMNPESHIHYGGSTASGPLHGGGASSSAVMVGSNAIGE